MPGAAATSTHSRRSSRPTSSGAGFEPGDWDCHNRDDVLRTLRQRHAAGFAEGRLNFHDAGSDVVVVTAHPSEIGGHEWPDETSTVIRFHEGKVVSMQDYRTEIGRAHA